MCFFLTSSGEDLMVVRQLCSGRRGDTSSFCMAFLPFPQMGLSLALQKLSTFAFCPYNRTLGINDLKEGGILVDDFSP